MAVSTGPAQESIGRIAAYRSVKRAENTQPPWISSHHITLPSILYLQLWLYCP
jgi:hypothetical protein